MHKKGLLKNSHLEPKWAALLSVTGRFNHAEDKEKRYKSHPLVSTMTLVRANTDKQSFAVLCYHS